MSETKLFIDSEGLDAKGPGDALIVEIQNHFRLHYEPATELSDCEMHISTTAVYNKLQALFPSPYYGPADVATWLKQLGYRWIDVGGLKFEWLIKKQR